MTALSQIPTRSEALADPAHAPWWALVAAVEAVRLNPSQRALDDLGAALERLLVAMDADAERAAA